MTFNGIVTSYGSQKCVITGSGKELSRIQHQAVNCVNVDLMKIGDRSKKEI